MLKTSDFVGFVLAAGQGKRIQEFTDTPKVLLELNGKYLVSYALDILEKLHIKPIVVVNHKKEDIMQTLGEEKYIYSWQKDRPGTAGAYFYALDAFQQSRDEFTGDIRNVLILQGDDTAFMSLDTIKKMIAFHQENHSKITLLTTIRQEPTGFGRIVKKDHKFLKIVEEKNCDLEEKKIKEVNTGVWIFDLDFLEKNITKVRENEISHEYYATDLVEIAVQEGIIVRTFSCNEREFFGINTEEQYKEAQRRMFLK